MTIDLTSDDAVKYARLAAHYRHIIRFISLYVIEINEIECTRGVRFEIIFERIMPDGGNQMLILRKTGSKKRREEIFMDIIARAATHKHFRDE